MELVVDDLQEFVAGLLPVAGGEVEGVAVGDVAGGVVVAGQARREFCGGVEPFNPDVKRGAGVVPGVAVPAALVAGDLHQEVAGIVEPEDVGVDVGTVEGAGDDILPVEGEAVFHRQLLPCLPALATYSSATSMRSRSVAAAPLSIQRSMASASKRRNLEFFS